jgi:hypothetical protein
MNAADADFSSWKLEVEELMRHHDWHESAINTVDWESWKEFYYNEGCEPGEALMLEYQAAM